jgi:regulator of sigma E protease
MTVILFLLVLAALIFVHELGHFAAAKKLGVRVDEFAIGFPPRIFSKIWRGTRYSLNLIPFGGYVAIFGENPDDESTNPAATDSFQQKAKWKQIVILLAGVFMNVLFAWGLYTAALSIGVLQTVDSNASDASVTVISVVPETPADDAGFNPGDVILSINDERVDTVEEVQEAIRTSTTSEIIVSYLNNDGAHVATVTPVSNQDGGRMIGVGLGVVAEHKLPFGQAIVEGAKETWYQTIAIAIGLGSLVRDAFLGQADLSMVSGPVGIAGMVGQASEIGLAQLLMFTAFISLNLAVLNALPFPALDGGRVLFVLIEAVIRRPLPRKWLNYANLIGFALLILLLILLTVRDVGRLL